MTKERDKEKIGWNFDNSYAQLPDKFFSMLNPTPAHTPELSILNHPLAADLGLNVQTLHSEDGVAVLAGNRVPEGALPLAQAYAGHQFGHFTMLGDGRALLLGEQITPQGERFDIQLKGSGRTPYSRRGDGRAALGPMLREYIISEAMHSLGIPTTRSLAVVTTGEPVIRETTLPGAVLTRAAASHLRVGTFQYAAQWGTSDDLRTLADYALKRHFPEVEADEKRYLSLLKEVIRRQAALIAKWQLVGFIHGVMNTDNMTISGETIDYGPCAFMNDYDRATVFSSIDVQGRYAYGNQPSIAGWNLARFAETLLPLLHDDQEKAVEIAQEAVTEFPQLYHNHWLAGMRAKLGLVNEEKEDEPLFKDLLKMMQKHHADYTNTYRALTFDKPEDTAMNGTPEFTEWCKRWEARLSQQQEPTASSHQLMKKSNPAVIPRNHRVEEALEAAVKEENYSVMERLLDSLSKPYAHAPEQAEYAAPPAPSCGPYRTFCGT
ncbi:YdiU family protein [Heliobacterium undosum]|uniref:Protein nucleotidyltransferase YdiU n=1 Tax=Heliomicrobium undosum TaxID=121734 RepID=A0A845L0K9_9FIRM|nr:YdiU family protein [Heliomicrobium undosum]MZP29987.1 YdiU family protein [Heliomicrobium undosum]